MIGDRSRLIVSKQSLLGSLVVALRQSMMSTFSNGTAYEFSAHMSVDVEELVLLHDGDCQSRLCCASLFSSPYC